mgnify:FL=1
MQQRYYDSATGLFLSSDPLRPKPSAGQGSNFNRYRYADSNPYKYVDPDGRCAMVTGSNICGNSVAIAMMTTTAAVPQNVTAEMVSHVGPSQGESEKKQTETIVRDANKAGQTAQLAGDSRAVKAFNRIDKIQIDGSDWSKQTHSGTPLPDPNAVAYAEYPGSFTVNSARYFALHTSTRVGKIVHEFLHLDDLYHEQAVKEFNDGCTGWNCPFEGDLDAHKNKIMIHYRPE